MAFVGIILILFLPVLIAQWIGIAGLGKTRNNAWWLMASGMLMATLGPIISIPLSFLLSLHPGNPSLIEYFFFAISAIFILGILTFAIGFAIHARNAGRIRVRVKELEMMNLAQATELERLRNL